MKERNEKLDFIKGLLIIGVVYGHILNAVRMDTDASFWIAKLIRAFDMPMFMLIGGYFLSKSISKYHPLKYIFNKITQLIFPLALWCIIVNIMMYLVKRQFSILSTLKTRLCGIGLFGQY